MFGQSSIIAQPSLDGKAQRRTLFAQTAVEAPFSDSPEDTGAQTPCRTPHGLRRSSATDVASIRSFDLTESVWSRDSDLTLNDLTLSDSDCDSSSHASNSGFATPSSSALPSPVTPAASLPSAHTFDHSSSKEPTIKPVPSDPDLDFAPDYESEYDAVVVVAADPLVFSPALLASLDEDVREDPVTAWATACYKACTIVPPTPPSHTQTVEEAPRRRSAVGRQTRPALDVVPDWRFSRSETDLSQGGAMEGSQYSQGQNAGFYPPGYMKPLPLLPSPSPSHAPRAFRVPDDPPPPFSPSKNSIPFIALEEPAFLMSAPSDMVAFHPVRPHVRTKSMGKSVGRLVHWARTKKRSED